MPRFQRSGPFPSPLPGAYATRLGNVAPLALKRKGGQKMKMKFRIFSAMLLSALTAFACAAHKDTATDHFGVQVHHAEFKSGKDFFTHYNKVMEITVQHKLGGEPVDMSWIKPDFREQLCLTVTINNHCVA
jgi:hypothetical protein